HSKLLKNASTDGGLKVEKESQPFSLSYREPLAHWREKGSDPFFDFGAGIGGADRDRTGDPLLAKQVLSQLSYSPSALPHLAERYASTDEREPIRTHPRSGSARHIAGLGGSGKI